MTHRPWLAHYDEGVPHTLQPYPEETLLDVVSRTAQERPDHAALLFKGKRITYRELEQLSDAAGAALAEIGVEPGSRVALLIPNTPQAVIAQLAVWKAGAIAVPLNALYTGPELEHALKDCSAETVIVLTPFYQKVKAIQPRTQVRRVVATSVKEHLPAHLRVLFTLLKEKKEGHRIELQAGDFWLGELIERHRGQTAPVERPAPDDPALLLYSGGTTGTPKGAIGTHQALLITAMQIDAWAAPLLGGQDAVGVLLMPLFHVYGNAGILGPALVGQNTLALVPNPRDLPDLFATIRQTSPDFIHGVPTLFNTLVNHPDVLSGKVDLGSVKVCISAAAPLMLETKQRFEKITGGQIVEAYGLTESMLAAVVTPPCGLYKPGAVGIPLPDVDVRIVDADTGDRDLAPGEVGEVLLGGLQLMRGYWRSPTETANAIRDGWLYTGDLGYLDEDGYLTIVDRKKDVIKPSGFQVWPREVEEVIAKHPAVAEVGVAGVPDPRQGEAVRAWVVLRPGHTATAEELQAFCREQLVAYKVPRTIEFCDSLPKSMVGKVLRRMLVEEATS